jgi:hypothetical protein
MDTIHPIVLFCYNRLEHLEKTIAALKLNDLAAQSDLFVFSDAAQTEGDEYKVKLVREFLAKIQGFKTVKVYEQTSNLGLATSIISGVTEVLQQHTACIVLEDDLEASPFFLKFLNEALTFYQNNTRIFSVSGYCPPIHLPMNYPFQTFLYPRINSWGWATWRDRWEKVDWEVLDFNRFISNKSLVNQLKRQGADLPVMLLKQQQGKIGSWAIRFNQACFNLGMTNVYPVQSLIRNQGIDGSGTHMKTTDKYFVELGCHALSPDESGSNPEINQSFYEFYKPSIYRSFINSIKIALYNLRGMGS